MKRSLAMSQCLLALLLVLGTAPALMAQEFSRVACKVVDQNDEALRGAVVTATTPSMPSFTTEATTSKRGKCVIALAKGTVPYLFTVELEGFQTLEVEVQPEVGSLIRREFKLSPAGGTDTSTAVLTSDEKKETRAGARNIILYNQGIEAQTAGDLETALERLRASIELDPEFAPAYDGLAAVALKLGQYQEAADAAEHALGIDSEDYLALTIRYDAFRELGDDARAKDAAKALQKAGDAKEMSLRVFQEAVTSFNQGDVDLAKARFQQALELDPELVEAYANLTQIYNQEGSFEQAAEMAAQTLKRQPENTTALRIRYDALRRLGDMDGARQAVRTLIAADPEWASTNLLAHAQELFNGNQVDEATMVLEELITAQPDLAGAHYLLGLCLNSRGDMTAAAQHLKRFLELEPDHAEAPVAREILSYIK